MSTLTTVLSLRKPDGTDFVSRVLDLNNNYDLIDSLFNVATGHSHAGSGTSGRRITTFQDVEGQYDPVEAATFDTLTGASHLINNMNRIRFWLTQISGQALGTVGTNLNAHIATTPALHGSSSFNYTQLTGATTGNPPTLTAVGGDTNVGISLVAKGTGAIVLNASTVTHNGTVTGITSLTATALTVASDEAGTSKVEFYMSI